MPTINAKSSGSTLLSKSKQLTLTPVSSGSALVIRKRGGQELEKTSISVSTTFGPYLDDMQFEIWTFSAAFDYSVAEEADQAGAMSDAVSHAAAHAAMAESSRTAVLCGDSNVAGGNAIVSGVTVSAANGVATVSNATSHGLAVGNTFFLCGADDTSAWGVFAVATRIDANSFTFNCPATYPAAVTGSSLSVINLRRQNDRNFMVLANASLGSPLSDIHNRAAPGMRTDQILARFADDCLSLRPAIIYIGAGTNDCLQGIADAVIQANMQELVTRARRSGAKVLLATLPPIGPSAVGYTAAIAARVMRVNRWIRQYADSFSDVRVVDIFGSVASVTADWVSGYTSDYIHPNGASARRIADAIYPILSNWLPPSPPRVSVLVDRYASDSSNRQLNSNPIMNGTGGTESGGATGDTADTYTLSKTGTLSVAGAKEARTDGRGFSQVLTITGAVNGDACDLLGSSQHAIIAAGDRLKLWLSVAGTGITGLANMRAYLEIVVDGVTYSLDAVSGSGGTYQINSDFDTYLQSAEFIVPPGSVTIMRPRVQFVFGGAGGGVFRVGCISVERLG